MRVTWTKDLQLESVLLLPENDEEVRLLEMLQENRVSLKTLVMLGVKEAPSKRIRKLSQEYDEDDKNHLLEEHL